MINNLETKHLVESTMNKPIYIESKLDSKRYCKTNGQFTRHLRDNNLTYQLYFETYVSGYTPLCLCGKPLTFYQNSETYANSCGDATCVGRSVSASKSQWTVEEKHRDSVNKKLAAARRTADDIKTSVIKAKETFIKKYGTEWVTQSAEFKTKSAKSKMERYGDSTYNNSQTSQLKNKNKTADEKNSINDTRRKTNLELYGVENCFLRLDVKTKSAKSNSLGREFILPSGRVIRIRGYEDIAITALLHTYTEDALVVDDMLHKYTLPVFEYVNVNQHTAKYYPDIYIPEENKIIEVKSRWWWDGNGDDRYESRLTNNLKKRQAVLATGYDYELWLYENKDTYRVLRHDSDFQA